jgi:1-deoxy-D-xylulose-5-phosphate reductoisomerase
MPCVLNAANEVANEAFRRDVCGFMDIERIVSAAMDAHEPEVVSSLEQLEEIDAWARAKARAALGRLG